MFNDQRLEIIRNDFLSGAIYVEPMKAGEDLSPISFVRLKRGKAIIGVPPIGIVDPTLERPIIKKGEMFWLLNISSISYLWGNYAGDIDSHDKKVLKKLIINLLWEKFVEMQKETSEICRQMIKK